MNKISSIANTNEILEVCQALLALSKKNPVAEDLYLTGVLTKIKTNTDLAVAQIKADLLNSNLREKDELRDLDLRAIFYEVEAKCHRRPDENQNKALRCKEVLDKFGLNIARESYTNESAAIRAIISDLSVIDEEGDDLPELSALLANLKSSQLAFDGEFSKLIEDKKEHESVLPASSLARELYDIVNNELLSYINGMSLAMPDKYKVFSDLLGILIHENNKSAKVRLAAFKRKAEIQ